MRRTTPDLVGSRKTIYSAVSIGLLVLSIAYVLWANYIVFVGGNLPLTSISLGEGSTGAGLTMLFLGDLIAVMLLWFVVDGVLLRLLHMALRTGTPRPTATVPPQQQWQPQGQAQQQWQPQGQAQPQNQWQPQGQQQWQPQNQWQPQGQQQWQPQNQWQPQGQQQWQPQGQWQQTPPAAPPAGPGSDPGSQATLVAQPPPRWSPPSN